MNWESYEHLIQYILEGLIQYILRSHFEEDGTRNYSVFQLLYSFSKRIGGVGTGDYIYFWKSKGLSDENIYSSYYKWS